MSPKTSAAALLVITAIGVASASIQIPDRLKYGKMQRYAACRKLFAQDELPYAVVTETTRGYTKICNCTFSRESGRSGLNIECRMNREFVLPIVAVDPQYGQILYYVVRYRKGQTGEWQEKTVELSDNREVRLDLDVSDGSDVRPYIIEVYVVQPEGYERRIQTNKVDARSGRILSQNSEPLDTSVFPVYQPGGVHSAERTDTQYSFSMNFDQITDTSMEVTFTAQSPTLFKVEYLDGTHRVPLHLDASGSATLRDLEPDTQYTFIISYFYNGEWVEMRRKPVRTRPTTSVGSFGNSYYPVYVGQDITLECPQVHGDTLIAISWFKGPDRTTARLLGTYSAEDNAVTYPSDRDPRVSVTGRGRILKISQPTPEYAGYYKCRYSIVGLGDTWRSAVESRVTLYITWRTRNGIETYLIQYRPFDKKASWQLLTLPNSGSPNTVITDLQPLTTYEFEVYDYSQGQKGDLLDSLTATTGTSAEPGTTIPIPSQPEQPDVDHCLSYPCTNGNCRSTDTGYECICHPGWTGTNCDAEVDHCSPYPCQYGVCDNSAAGYECTCYRGYSGANCERVDEVDHCSPNPCVYGDCRNTAGGYECRCDVGYTGRNCAEVDEVDHCSPDPCVYGDCRNTADGYECTCDTGYTGRNCDEEINYCLSGPCVHGICRRRKFGYVCDCSSGFSGTNCDEEVDYCASINPCLNGGRCVSQSAVGTYACRCRAGFTGANCENSRNLCNPNPCLNSGLCVRGRSSGYACRCRRGYSGSRCETAPYLVLKCPDESRVYGPAESIRWYKYVGDTPLYIYEYDLPNQEGIVHEASYSGRLSSPSANFLKISNRRTSDLGSYECRVSYEEIRVTSLPMNLYSVPAGRSSLVLQWTPTLFDINSYLIQYRDATTENGYTEQRIPKEANTFEIYNLNPGDIYDITLSLTPRGDSEKIPVQFSVLGTTQKPSRADRIPDYTAPTERVPEDEVETIPDDSGSQRYSTIPVRVYGPISPVATGAVAHLECDYSPDPTNKPRISWKKISGGSSRFLYNQQMPPPPSASRITMINERTLRIKNFQPTDAGTYECKVTFKEEAGIRVGSGTADVVGRETPVLAPPTNFRYDIMNPTATNIRWQQPQPAGVTGYAIRYWPTTRRFGDYQEATTSAREITLEDLTEETEYNVEIRATNDRSYSEPLVARFEQFTEDVPTPTNFDVGMLSRTTAKVSWDQPNPEGITRYLVQYWDVSQPYEDTVQELTTSGSPVVLTGLKDGTVYQVWIKAYKGDKPSPQLSRQFTKVTPTPPNPPKKVRFKNVDTDSFTVYWLPPTGWKPTDKYRVDVQSMDEDSPFSKQFPDSAPNTLNVRQLEPGVLYRVMVTTIRNGLQSRPVNKHIRTIQNIALAAPYPEKLTLQCRAHVIGEPYKTTWYKVSPTEQLLFTSIDTTSRREFTPNEAATEYSGRLSSSSLRELDIANIRYPSDFGAYKCTITSRYDEGSDVFNVIVKYPQRIEAPVRFSFENTGPDSARIMWRHPYPEDITSYVVRYWPTIRRFDSERTFTTTEMWADLVGLIEGTEYQVEIKSKINEAVSDDSLIGQLINFAGIVRNVTIDRLGDGVDLRISWENPPGLDGVQISFRREGSHRWNDQPPMPPDRTSKKVRIPLEDGETVDFKITSLKNNIPTPTVVHYTEHSIVDVEEPGPAPEVSKPENIPLTGSKLPYPSAPSNLVLQSVSPSILAARWDPTPDVQFDTYFVNVTNLFTNEYEHYNVPDSHIQVGHLTPYATYEVVVSTVRNGIYSFPISKVITLSRTPEVEPGEETAPSPDVEREPAPWENNEREDTSVVPAPTNLRFSNVMRSRLTISWDAPDDEDVTDFSVKYRPNRGNREWINRDVFGDTNVTIRELAPDTTYEVKVSSYTDAGRLSSPLTGTIRTQGYTERRVILRRPHATIVDKTNDSFTVRWVAQDTDHRVTVTPLGGEAVRQILDVERGTDQVAVTGLDAGRRHRITVIALADGRRSKSASLLTTTKPNMPTNLRPTAVDSTDAVIGWTEPVSTLTTGYRIIYYPKNTNLLTIRESGSNRLELTDLEPDTEYVVNVHTKQGNEQSAPASVTFRTAEELVDAPRDIKATPSGDDIEISWFPVDDAEFYEVTYRLEDDEEATHQYTVEAPSTSVKLQDLFPGHYIITVTAANDVRQSKPRNITQTMPVKAPTDLQISSVRSDGFRAIWQPPSTRLYYPQYDVIALPNRGHAPIHLPSEKRTSRTGFDFERLAPNTEYTVEVVSRYGDMKSEPLTASVRTAPVEAPRDVQSSVSDGVISLAWTPVYDADNYKVVYYPVGNPSDLTAVDVTSPSYSIANAGPGEYEIRIVAVKNGQESSPIAVRNSIGIDAPRELRFTDISDDSIVVEWTPPRTRQRFQYEVKVLPEGRPDEPVGIELTEENWRLIEGLAPGTEYTVHVTSLFGDERSEPIIGDVITAVPIPRRVEVPATVGNLPVEVSWEDIPEADSYEIVYYPTSGGEPVTVNVPGGRNTVILDDLVPETEYVIEVVTLIGSEKSEPHTATLTTGSVSQPEYLDAEVTDGVARVSWTPVENVDEYEVTYYPVGDDSRSVTRTVVSPYYDISGVEPGEYEITVTASKDGHKSPSAVLDTTIGVKKPTDLLFADVIENSFTAIWTPSSTPGVTDYEIHTYTTSSEPIVERTTENFITVTDLSPGVDYIIEVRARKLGQTSSPLSGTVTTAVPRPIFVHGSVLPGENEPVELTWEDIPYVDSYQVRYYPVGGSPQEITVPGGTSRTILSGLRPDTEYVVEVTSVINGERSEPTELEIRTPLGTPENVLVQPHTPDERANSTITITWEDRGVVPEYEIKYYSVVPVGDDLVYGEPQYKVVSASEEGVVLTDLLPATEYIVEIKALDGSKESRPNKVTILTELDQPENVEIEEPTEDSITVNWEPPTGQVTEYVVKLVPGDGSDVITIPVDADRRTVTATGLQPGTEYEVHVIAQNTEKGIESVPLIERTITRLDVRPSNLRIAPDLDGSYIITWDAPDREVPYYEVTWRKVSDSTTEEKVQVFDGTEARTTPLEPKTEYVIIIQSVTGPSQPATEYNSATARITTVVPGLESPLTFPDVTDDSIVVHWNLPAQDNFLSGYRVLLYPDNEDQPLKSVDVPRSEDSTSFTGLQPNTIYRVTVTPHIENIPGETTTQYITTERIVVPVPELISVTNTTSDQIVVQWDHPANHHYITQYNVRVQDQDGNLIWDQSVPSDVQELIIPGLKPETNYNVYVRSVVDGRTSEPAPVLARTLPKKPDSITPSRVLSHQFEVSWSRPENQESQPSYLVTVIPESNPDLSKLFYYTDDTSILIPGVQPDTTYRVEVITVTDGGEESSPSVIRVTTGRPAEERPTEDLIPDDAMTVVSRNPEMVIVWQPYTDDTTTSYQILYLTEEDDTPQIINVPAEVHEMVLSSLVPETDYHIWVRGILENGTRVPIQILRHGTVTELEPDNYEPLTEQPITAPADGRVSVTWEDLGPDITQYGLQYTQPGVEGQKQVVVPGTYTNIMLSGLVPGEEYIIKVIGMRNGVEPVLVKNVHVGTSDVVSDDLGVSGSTPNGQITLRWVSDIEDDEDNEVIGYKINFDRKCCLGEPEMAWVDNKDTDTATVSMLEPDTEYVFWIEAVTDDGQNIPVSNVNIVDEVEFPETRLSEDLQPPTDLSIEAEGFTSTVHWRPPEEGRTPVTNYIITYTPINNEFAPMLRVTVPSSETSHTMTGLSSDTQYNIEIHSANLPTRTTSWPGRIRYLTPVDDSYLIEPNGDDVEVTTRPPPTTPRSVPTIATRTPPNVESLPTTTKTPVPLENTERTRTTRPVTVSQPDESTLIFTPDDGDMTVAWEPYFTSQDYGRYRITYYPRNQPDDLRELVLPQYVNRATITSLQPDVEYETHVEAVTDTNEEIPRQVTVIEEEVPETLRPYQWIFPPEISDIERQGVDTAIVHWNNPRRQPSKVTHFILRLKPKYSTDRTKYTTVQVPADVDYHVLSGLEPDVDYVVTLQAANEDDGTRSTTVTSEFTNGVPDEPGSEDLEGSLSTQPSTTPTTFAPATTPVSTSASTTSRRTLATRTPETTPQPQPLIPNEREPQTGDEEDTDSFTGSEEPGVGALPTFDGNVIINWTPVKTPVDSYILRWEPIDKSSPARNITVPGDRSWANIPEVPQGEGYNITVLTTRYGREPEVIYTINLNREPGDDGGFTLSYRPVVRIVTQDGTTTRIRPGTDRTHEVYIPIERPDDDLPDDEYQLQRPNPIEGSEVTRTDGEYVKWLQPVQPTRVDGADSVTLRWNPDPRETTRTSRYKLELHPINNPDAETLVRYVPGNAPYKIRGLEPGVSYKLRATYIGSDGEHRTGEQVTEFRIPAFSRFGHPITERRYGISDVWMRELRSGELLLQWEEFPGARQYRVDHQEGPDGEPYQDFVNRDQRWIVLPRLAPGSMYTLNIYALVQGTWEKIYTVTVKRKVTGPAPPSKIEWYNMFGHSVDLSWIPPQGYITGYKVTYHIGTGDDAEIQTVYLTANTTKYHLDNLIPGETYTITVQTMQDGKLSRPLSFPLRMSIPTVRRIFFQQTEPNEIVIRWPKLPDYVTGYLVQVKTVYPAGPDLVPPRTLPPDQTSFTVDNILPGVKYEFNIRTLVEQAESDPVALHLWTLKAETEINRVPQTGKWMLSWTGDPASVDHWRIEVRRAGSTIPVYRFNDIPKSQTSYELPPLSANVEYFVYIYGVKGNQLSTPIQIRVPVNPYGTTTSGGGGRHQQHTVASGQQLLRRFLVRRRPTEIEIELIPISTVDKYVVKYKKNTESLYRTDNVVMSYGTPTRARISNLDSGSRYNITILAIQGEKSSEMSINVDTPSRAVQRTPLPPVQRFRRVEDPGGSGFTLSWSSPLRVRVSYYTVTYNYTGMTDKVIRRVIEPSIYVPKLREGQSATFAISYTTVDRKQGPTSHVNMSSGVRARTVRSHPAHRLARTEERDELP